MEEETNTGHRNTGSWNTGHRNTGNGNTGNLNTGNLNTGCFNTKTPDGGYFFNKWLTFEEWQQAYIPRWLHTPKPTNWINAANMSDAEKAENPDWEKTGGYLRKNNMRDEWRKAYEDASEDDIQAVRDLPNFDYDVFEEITGLDLRVKSETAPDVIEINGKKYKLTEIE